MSAEGHPDSTSGAVHRQPLQKINNHAGEIISDSEWGLRSGGGIISGSRLDKGLSSPQIVRMKIAKKSSQSRQTLTLSRPAFDILDMLRGGLPKSVFVQELLEKEKLRREREVFYRDAVAAYTPEVCRETLELNKATPYVTE
jgi:hypothetical protein